MTFCWFKLKVRWSKLVSIDAFYETNALVLCHVWNFFPNVKQALKKIRLTLSTTDFMGCCNRLLTGFNRKILQIKKLFFKFINSYTNCMHYSEFFLKSKTGIKERNDASCRIDVLYYFNRILICSNGKIDDVKQFQLMHSVKI